MRIGDLSVWPQRDWKDRSFPFWLNVFITHHVSTPFVSRWVNRLERKRPRLHELCLGDTATGTVALQSVAFLIGLLRSLQLFVHVVDIWNGEVLKCEALVFFRQSQLLLRLVDG